MNSKVSVIIPVYNVSSYLSKCLNSVINQSLIDIEIIVVNDGSTDDSILIINKYSAIDDRIIVINKYNEGLPYARKSGIEIAKAEYIYHLDGDDYLCPGALQALYEKAKVTEADIVVGDFLIKYVNQSKEDLIHYENFEMFSNEMFLCNIIRWKQSYLCGKLFKTTLYKSNKIIVPKNISFGEDNVAIFQLGYFANKIVKINEVIFVYCIRESSISFIINANKSQQLLESAFFVKSFFKTLQINSCLKSHIKYFLLKNIFIYFSANKKILPFSDEIQSLLNSNYRNDPIIMNLLKKEPKRVRITLRLLETNTYIASFTLGIFTFSDKLKNLKVHIGFKKL